MKMIVVFAVFTVTLFGCANTPQKCVVATSHSPTEFDICMGSKDVKKGDRLVFYKMKCTTASRGTPKKCNKDKIGEGSVINTLDEHLSTVKLDSEFEINESTIIERQ